MEDRYLFKAKTARIVDTYNNAEDGIWVKGSLREDCGKYIIFQFEFDRADYVPYEVDPSTICQCTGLKDKNGKLIWENDIVKYGNGNFYKAFWRDTYYQLSWICVKSDIFRTGSKWCLWRFESFEIEVVGNIFDNPELLESEGQYDRK